MVEHSPCGSQEGAWPEGWSGQQGGDVPWTLILKGLECRDEEPTESSFKTDNQRNVPLFFITKQ